MKNAIHHIIRVLIIRCQLKPGIRSHGDFQELLVIMISKVAPITLNKSGLGLLTYDDYLLIISHNNCIAARCLINMVYLTACALIRS